MARTTNSTKTTNSKSPQDKTQTVTIHDQKLERGAGGELHQTRLC